MNEFESDWISLSQSFVQNGWIQDGRIQDGGHHQVESEWMSDSFFVQMVETNLGKCEWVWEEKLRWLNPRWWNSRWQNSRWLPSSSWVRMNKFESVYISSSQSECSERVFEWIWEKKTRCLNPTWQNSRWLPSSSWVRVNEWSFFVQMVGREVEVKSFLCKWWEPILASVSEFERKN